MVRGSPRKHTGHTWYGDTPSHCISMLHARQPAHRAKVLDELQQLSLQDEEVGAGAYL